MTNLPRTDRNYIVVFVLEEPRYALPLSVVERIVRAVEITLLPKAPEIILGVINMQGQILPVIDIRKRFRLPTREIHLEDHFIIARTPRRNVVLTVDSVVGVREPKSHEMMSAEQVFPFAEYIQGVARIEDNIILINDLDQFLSIDEERMLDLALSTKTE